MQDPAPTPFTRSGSNVLPPKQSMTIGQYIVSPNGRYKLVLQSDSNLVLWDGETPVWAGNTDQPYSMNLTHRNFQSTRFYVSNSGYLEDSLRQRSWMMNTNNASDNGLWERSHLVVQDDANIVILDIKAVYSSNTRAALLPNAGDVTIFPPGTSLDVGRKYPAGDFFIVFQADGNLVVYDKADVVIWHANTYGKDAKTAVMQADGNFVIYSSTGVPLWNSQTGNFPGAYAQLQSNGAFVICAGVPIWARFGWVPGKAPKVFYPDNGPWKTYDRVIYTF